MVAFPDYGIVGQQAPELRVPEWLANVDGDRLLLANINEPFILLYNFQSWCPGCHSHGFPTLVDVKTRIEAGYDQPPMKFIIVQTVFEGHDTNTAAAALASIEQHGVTDVALGHDSGEPPNTMADYRTGGTPWFVLIGRNRTVLADGFHFDADAVINAVDRTLAELDPRTQLPAGQD